MAVVLIHDGFLSGALAGMLATRAINLPSQTAAGNATYVTAAAAFATQAQVANAALGVPMADADHAAIATMCFAAGYAAMAGSPLISATAGDYAALATEAVAAAKQGEASMTS